MAPQVINLLKQEDCWQSLPVYHCRAGVSILQSFLALLMRCYYMEEKTLTRSVFSLVVS